MPSIYVSRETKEKLYKVLNRDENRLSPLFGSPKRFKTPNDLIAYLLRLLDKYPFRSLDTWLNVPFVEGAIRGLTDEEFEEFEEKGELRKIVDKQFDEEEEEHG